MLLIGGFSLVAVDNVFADQEGDYTYTVSNGEATITKYTCNDSTVNIPSTLGGYPTIAIAHHAFYSCTTLTSVSIPDSVISIGESAFSYCSALRTVSIGNNVITIENTAFSFCPLTSVTFGNKVATIGDAAFASCTSLTSVTLPDSVTTIGAKAFHSCTSLSSVDIGTSVTTIEDQAFDHCSSLNTVTIPDSVITIGDSAFSHCSSLLSVTIGSHVQTIGYSAFSNCPFTTVTIPNNVTIIDGYAFYSCFSLETVIVGNKVKSIGTYAFASCSSLISISFLGLVAPTSVKLNWIKGTPTEIRGHAYAASNFPTAEQVVVDFHGLKMGTVLQVENKLPQADFTWSPLNLTLNQTITFDASTSSDQDGSLILYEWDWNTDGVFEEFNTTQTTTHSWTQAGNYSVTLRVTDNRNATATKTKILSFIRYTDNEINTTETPGFEILAVIFAITIAALVWRKRQNY